MSCDREASLFGAAVAMADPRYAIRKWRKLRPFLPYSGRVIVELNELCTHQVRAELDGNSDHIKAKIANAEQMKVHTMFVIGKRDMEANAVSVRVHGKGNLGAKPRDEVMADILQSIKERRSE